MPSIGKKKHQITCGNVIWSRIGELAERRGISRGEVIEEAFTEYEASHTSYSLVERATMRPLVTGEHMLAQMLFFGGDEEQARRRLSATKKEWDEAVNLIQGLRAEFNRRWPKDIVHAQG